MDWLIGIAPILVIALLCPLMMIFMMKGMHGGHGSSDAHEGHHPSSDAQRLAELEREVARLRQERDGGSPVPASRTETQREHS